MIQSMTMQNNMSDVVRIHVMRDKLFLNFMVWTDR